MQDKAETKQLTVDLSGLLDLEGSNALRSPPDAGAMQWRARLARYTGTLCILIVDLCARDDHLAISASKDYSSHKACKARCLESNPGPLPGNSRWLLLRLETMLIDCCAPSVQTNGVWAIVSSSRIA